jgi:alpha-ketoglutarate-dependent taurine dioxygenase
LTSLQLPIRGSGMLSQVGADPHAWRADTIDDPLSWYYALHEDTLSALDAIVRQARNSQSVTGLRVPAEVRDIAAADVRPIEAALEARRGWAIITAGRAGRYAPEELRTVYWLFGQLLGSPIAQDVQGTLLYDVRDAGQDVRFGARFSVTSAESTFHTDNSFGDEVLDYVGLLCLNTAKSGGLSQIVSGHSVWNELLAQHPSAAEVLRQPFHFDRRGGLRPGDEPTARFPIFTADEPELLIRYLRYWIEVGHDKAGQPLTAAQVEALNCLDSVAGLQRFRVEFALRPGEMLFINNRWILHNRTAFEDFTEPARKRHYVRLWLQRSAVRAESYS